jgi:ABC-type nitrate/sulfonate/bicarbonate transport system substrate-binding protein
MIAASGAVGALLEAGASPAGATPEGLTLTPVTYQLGWLANVENGGEFVADTKGYFADEGIKITLLAGGPTTSVEPEIVSGKCLLGLSLTDTCARANVAGANLRVIGATLQNCALAIMSLQSKPYDTPSQLIGKRLGVQSFQEATLQAFFSSIKVDWHNITFIPASGDPSILPAGEVDALVCLTDNEPITLALQGVKTHLFTLAEYGWIIYGDTLEVSKKSLNNYDVRDTIVHLMRAVIRGWQTALANPSATVSSVVNNYGKDLKLSTKQQTLELAALTGLLETPYTKAHGLLMMSPADIERNLKSVHAEGIPATESSLFDTTVLEDAYNGKTTIT